MLIDYSSLMKGTTNGFSQIIAACKGVRLELLAELVHENENVRLALISSSPISTRNSLVTYRGRVCSVGPFSVSVIIKAVWL